MKNDDKIRLAKNLLNHLEFDACYLRFGICFLLIGIWNFSSDFSFLQNPAECSLRALRFF